MRNQTIGLSTGAKIGIVAAILIAVTVAVAMLPGLFLLGQEIEEYPTVTVTGRVKTLAAYPERVEFTDSTGEKSSATVSNESFNAGSYNLTLPNRESYTVMVVFSAGTKGARPTLAECDGGTLTLDVDASMYTYDTVC